MTEWVLYHHVHQVLPQHLTGLRRGRRLWAGPCLPSGLWDDRPLSPFGSSRPVYCVSLLHSAQVRLWLKSTQPPSLSPNAQALGQSPQAQGERISSLYCEPKREACLWALLPERINLSTKNYLEKQKVWVLLHFHAQTQAFQGRRLHSAPMGTYNPSDIHITSPS